MTVSIIVPNYNHARFLKQRIDSILAQSFQDFELILLDDCSTDDSLAVINQYRDHPRVSHIVVNEQNSGSLFRQWQKGISLASAAAVWIAESDDYADPEFLAALVPVLESNPRLGLVYADSYIVQESSPAPETYGAIKTKWLNNPKWTHDYTATGADELRDSLLAHCTINNASAVLFRKEALIAADPFGLPLRYCGDWACYIRLALRYDIAYVGRPLNYYREHANNTFQKSRQNGMYVWEHFQLYNWILGHTPADWHPMILERFNYHARVHYSQGERITRERLRDMYRLNPGLLRRLLSFNLREELALQYRKIPKLFGRAD